VAFYGNSSRLKVNVLNQLVQPKHIFAIGAIARMTTEIYPKGRRPQLANVAINQAKNLGKNLNSLI
jgi:NADH dehydrogenase